MGAHGFAQPPYLRVLELTSLLPQQDPTGAVGQLRQHLLVLQGKVLVDVGHKYANLVRSWRLCIGA